MKSIFKWVLVIFNNFFDECYNIKNVKTKKFQSTTLLRAEKKMLLSGLMITIQCRMFKNFIITNQTQISFYFFF
jgi:hypothetical protein